jgi:membrane-bound lytic murein transglycosylase B
MRHTHRAAHLFVLGLVGPLGLGALLICQEAAAQTPPGELRPLRDPVEQFISHMVATHGFDRRELQALFAKVQPSQSVGRAIAAPATAKPWHEFRALFVDGARIEGGARFWSENADTLARARTVFGVPENVIVALIGIETRYGRVTGSHKVIEALYTLAFELQNRADFFRGELEQFLLLAREQQWDLLAISGSYAGAMGLPQFMPSSYRRFAVDFDGNGRIDLWRDTADAIGSVANYLRLFGWRDGEPIAAPARVDSSDLQALLDLGPRPSLNLDQWRMRGVEEMSGLEGGLNASLFHLELVGGREFWLGFDNFYALFQYNRSRNYVMAVYELAQEIVRERERLARVE